MLHWKFAHHPLIIRYAQLYTIVGSRSLNALNVRLKTRQRDNNDPRTHHKTNNVYDPLLFVDDHSLQSWQYTRVKFVDVQEQESESGSGSGSGAGLGVIEGVGTGTLEMEVEADGGTASLSSSRGQGQGQKRRKVPTPKRA